MSIMKKFVLGLQVISGYKEEKMKELLYWIVRGKPMGNILQLSFVPIYSGKKYTSEDLDYTVGKSYYPPIDVAEKLQDKKYAKKWLNAYNVLYSQSFEAILVSIEEPLKEEK